MKNTHGSRIPMYENDVCIAEVITYKDGMADLLLAAPNLLEALIDAVKYMDKYKLDNTHYRAMRGVFKAAIAKAEGK